MIKRRKFLKLIGMSSSAAVITTYHFACSRKPESRPNILWLSCEDISPNLGCYGDPNAKTPNLDKLASEGVLYKNAFTVSGVCAPNRSCIITSVYPTTLGTHHMRAGGEGIERSIKPVRPSQILCFSEYLRKHGYYCTNNYKEDYQFVTPPDTWDESSKNAHWRNRPDKNNPFFAVFNYVGTHEGSVRLSDQEHALRIKRLKPSQRQEPDKLKTLPPYYPDTKVTRKQWAKYNELITTMDYWIQDRLKELEDDGVAEDTIVFFWSDHGVGLPRAKRWVYDSGTHIPLIVRIPSKFRIGNQANTGSIDYQLVSSIDLAPTVLNLAGVDIPEYMQGRPFLGPNLPSERQYVYAARDRMDERYDIIRMVRDKHYKYIRNYEPFKEYYQYINTAEKDTVIKEIRRLHKKGQLPREAELFMADVKPIEELYDIQKDPNEVNNLAEYPQFKDVLNRMRKAHLDWMFETRDLGLIPEPELANMEKTYGNRYAILLKPEGKNFLKRLIDIASVAGSPDPSDNKLLLEASKDEEASVRYWAAIGLGNLVQETTQDANVLLSLLNDKSAVVRVAAARALCKMNEETRALPILIQELQSDQEWIRLYAATVLDRIGEKAKPAIPYLKNSLKDKVNKYVVRVANHALNVMLGTDNQVR